MFRHVSSFFIFKFSWKLLIFESKSWSERGHKLLRRYLLRLCHTLIVTNWNMFLGWNLAFIIKYSLLVYWMIHVGFGVHLRCARLKVFCILLVFFGWQSSLLSKFAFERSAIVFTDRSISKQSTIGKVPFFPSLSYLRDCIKAPSCVESPQVDIVSARCLQSD